MSPSSLSTTAKIARVRELLGQQSRNSKLYPLLEKQLAQLVAEAKAEAAERLRQEAAAQAAAEAAAREQAQSSGSSSSESSGSGPLSSEPLYYARGCFKGVYQSGVILWGEHELPCWSRRRKTPADGTCAYFRVYPRPSFNAGQRFQVSHFQIQSWVEDCPAGYADGEFQLGGCWIHTKPVDGVRGPTVFRVYRNERHSPKDKAYPLSLSLHWPGQAAFDPHVEHEGDLREIPTFYEIKASYDAVSNRLVFKELLRGPLKMPPKVQSWASYQASLSSGSDKDPLAPGKKQGG